jgi:hypothetical protein
MEGVSFTGAQLALVAGLLSCVVGGLGIVFWQMIGIYNRALKRAEDQADQLLPLAKEQIVSVHTAQTLMIRDIDGFRSEVRERLDRLERLGGGRGKA